jgi:hypothetical protein
VFNNSGSWTAPSGVTQISSLVIAGGLFSQVPDSFFYSAFQEAVTSTSGFPPTPRIDGFITYAQATSHAEGVLSDYNLGAPADRIVGFSTLDLGNNFTGSQPPFWTKLSDFISVRVRGTATRAYGPWDNRSGQVANGNGAFWYIGVEVFSPGGESPGSPSSAFGSTAAGTTSAGQPQFVTNVASVSVTPGQTYQITVGQASGSVQFQFTQG